MLLEFCVESQVRKEILGNTCCCFIIFRVENEMTVDCGGIVFKNSANDKLLFRADFLIVECVLISQSSAMFSPFISRSYYLKQVVFCSYHTEIDLHTCYLTSRLKFRYSFTGIPECRSIRQIGCKYHRDCV